MHLNTISKKASPLAMKVTRPPQFGGNDYLATMCHEIRTPLNAIIGLSTIPGSLKCSPDKQKQCADMLHDSSQMLLQLVNGLLDSFKLDNGKVILEHIVFDLSKVLEEAKNIITVQAQEKELVVLVLMDRETPCMFMGDPLRIRQILVNLLSNAVKFTHHGVISMHLTETALDSGHCEISITVADSGIGMEKEKLGIIFDKYSQGNTSIARKYGGTGLGLFISQELAHLMNGNITVKSWPHMGSHFTLTLQLQKALVLKVAS